MYNKTYFIIGGVISFSFFIFTTLFFIYYIATPKVKTYTAKSKTTVIELDMILEKSDKKRIEKKEDKKIEKHIDKLVKKSTSASNKKRPNVKSLFGKVKTKSVKTTKQNVNNVRKSLDPKRFKSKFEKQKKSSNVKIDKLLNNKRTTTNITSLNKTKNKESDDYYSKINSLLSVWSPTIRENGLNANVIISINSLGTFDYRFVKFSENSSFNESLKAFLEEQKSIIYPKPKKNRTVQISVDFKSEG